MNNTFFTFIFIPIIILSTMAITRSIRKKLAKPEETKGVQKPGKFDSFLLKFFRVLAVFCGILTVLGIVIQEVEMAIVFGIMTLIFAVVVVFLKRAYDMTYQENTDYFILKTKGQEYKVFYENIIDWQPDLNQIFILDESRLDNEYINVNISMLKPEILLQRIAEMTFAGKFRRLDTNHLDDPMRKNEIVNYLIENNYGYLVEDYLEETK